MVRIKEEGKYIYRVSKAELKKRYPLPDLILVPYKKYQKKGVKENRFKFVNYSEKNKTIVFKITKRD